MSKIKAKKLVYTKDMPRLEWLVWRQKGIGGSDAAAIAGLNKYQDPIRTYIDKVEPITEEAPMSEAAEWGIRNEPTIRNKFIEMHPELRVQRSFILWQHPQYHYMLANVDGLVYRPDKGWGILEVKTAHEWLKDNWSEEEVPEHYLIQIQHYLAVLGLDFAYFAVLIGGNKYKEFYVERNEELIAALIEIEKDFWINNVMAKNPPNPNGSESAGEALLHFFPASEVKDSVEVKELDDSNLDLINEYNEILQQEKALAKRKAEIQQLLQNQLGEYQVGMIQAEEDQVIKVNWKPSRSFSEKDLKAKEPDLYNKYIKPGFDKAAFKKSNPKKYDEFMIHSGKRSFSIK